MKNFLALSMLVIIEVLGNVWLSRGIRQIGEVQLFNPHQLVLYGLHLLINPWVVLGVTFLIAFFLLYLVALSKLDLSYVLPMTASGYIMNAVFAWLILGEKVSLTRWAGTLFVTIGILIVGFGETFRKPSKDKKSPKNFP